MAKKIAVGQRYYNYGFTDSLLFSEAYMRARYKGCKLIAKEINKYTDYTQDSNDFNRRMGSRLQVFFKSVGTDFIGFIKTTKPMDGTFAFPYTIKLNNNGVLDNYWFQRPLKGRLLFPAGRVKSLKNLINQRGNFRMYNGVYTDPSLMDAIEDVFYAWESQFTGGYHRDISYGKLPVIEVKTNTIYEYDWGGSTYPEIAKGGAVHLKQIINVDDYSANLNTGIHIVNENDTLYNEWDQTLQKSLQKGDKITLKQYSEQPDKSSGISGAPGFDPNIGNTSAPVTNIIAIEPGLNVPSFGGVYTETRNVPVYQTSSAGSTFLNTVVSAFTWGSSNPGNNPPQVTNITVPYLPEEPGLTFPYDDRLIADSNGNQVLASSLRNISGSYYIPTTSSLGGQFRAAIGKGNSANPPYVMITNLASINHLKINPRGQYTTGSLVSTANVSSSLSASMANGNRHFVSFYGSLGNTAVGNLNQIGDPIEIKEVRTSGPHYPGIHVAQLILKDIPTGVSSSAEGGGYIGLGDTGILIWKAKKGAFAALKPPPEAEFEEYSYSRLKAGGFYREFSTDAVKNNFSNIVETVGIKSLK